jgi:hypothetical protein
MSSQIRKHFWNIFFIKSLISVTSVKLGYNNLQYGHRLDRHVIDSFMDLSLQDCAAECWRWPRCKSLNYHEGTQLCEISYQNKTQAQTLYLEEPYWIYSDKEDWDKVSTHNAPVGSVLDLKREVRLGNGLLS